MKTFFNTLFLVLAISQLSAQAPDISIDWGPISKEDDVDYTEMIGADDEFFYTYGTKQDGLLTRLLKTTYTIKKYSRKTYRPVWTREIDKFEYKDNKVVYRRSRLDGDQVHLYFDVYDNKNDRKYLVYRTLDEKGRVGPVQELDQIEAKRRIHSDFVIHTSEDSSKILVYANPPFEKKEDEKFKVKVVDNAHQTLWEKEILLPYNDKYFELLNQAVTNDGDVFIVGYSTPDKTKGEKKKRKAPNRSYKLFRVSENENDILEYDLSLDDEFVQSVAVSADFGNGTMGIVGFYGDDSYTGINGSFFITIDQKTLEVATVSTQPFTKEFLTNFMSERKAEKGKELREFTFRDLIRRKDGGAVIIAEQYYVRVVTSNMGGVGVGMGGTTTTYYYYYNDLIVLNIAPDGQIEWSSYVPKEQVSTNDGGFFSSYLLLVESPRLHFIYNDDRRNLERLAEGKDVKTMSKPKKSVAVITTVGQDGQPEYDQLFRNKDYSAILVPRKSYQVSDDEVIIYGIKGKKSRFGTMTFQ